MKKQITWNSRLSLSRWEWLALIITLALFLAQVVLSSPQKSAAFDEGYHLAAGYVYLKTGDFRLSRTVGHPPLANLLNALPLLLLEEIELPLDHPAWQNGDFQWFSDTFLWQVNENPQRMIETARLSSAVLGMLTALLLFIWARQLAGPIASWLALFLAIFDPNVIANARLITTDLALAFFVLLAMWRLWSWLERPHWLNLFWLGLAAGFAMATKYNGLLIWPIFLLVLLLYPGFSPRRFVYLVIMVLVAYFVVWGVYLFDVGPLPGSSIPIPAPVYPDAVWRTFNYINQQPVPAYLSGQVSQDGWWYYFPVTLAVKTPLPLLILAFIGLITAFISQGWRRMVVLWLPPLAYLGLAMLGRFNIGYRHILPVVPFLIMLASQTVRLPEVLSKISERWWVKVDRIRPLDSLKARIPMLVSILLALLLLWQVAGTVVIYPHYEAYFNEIAGGPEKGSEILVDSNIDWGQDLPALRDLMAQQNIDQVYFSYFGTAPPEAYGIDYKPIPGFLHFTTGPEIEAFNPYTPPPGWYAISATSLYLGLVRQNHDIYNFFRELDPVAKAGYSIHLYEVKYPDDTPINRMVVVGESVSDLSPEALGIRQGERTIVKWTESPDTTIIPADSDWPEMSFQGTSADFSGVFELIGYELVKSDYNPGENIQLTLYWRTESGRVPMPSPAMGDPLAAFVHLSGQDPGQIVAQYDGWGAALTGLEKGDIISQQVEIPLPDNTPKGTYTLRVGLYSPQNSERLPVTWEGGTTDFILLDTITVDGGSG
jgi:4-amino-4-deoxy-L-arabinose transferase-like glycosyltransferase